MHLFKVVRGMAILAASVTTLVYVSPCPAQGRRAAPAAATSPAAAAPAVAGVSSTQPAALPVWGAGPADEAGGQAVWRNADVRIAIGRGELVTCSATRAVVGRRVYDLRTGRQTDVTLERGYPGSAFHVISPDGKWFAAGIHAGSVTEISVRVWNLETGKIVSDVAGGGRSRTVGFVAFSSDGRLLLADGGGTQIEVWDFENNKLLRKFPVEQRGYTRRAISPDGRYLAVLGDSRVIVYDVQSGRQAAIMKQPSAKAGKASPAGRRDPRDDDWVLYTGMSALEFSTDGKELIGMFASPNSGIRILCWDTRGTVVADESPPADMFAGTDSIRWLPDSSAWLINGCYLFDRKSHRVVWRESPAFAHSPFTHFLDANSLLSVSVNHVVETRQIPWPAIRKSVEAMMDTGPAMLRPGQAVGVQVQIEGARGDAEQTKTAISEALRAALARNGIEVADGQGVTLTALLRERQGEARKVYSTRTGSLGHDTGRTANEAVGEMVIALWARDVKEPFWQDRISETSEGRIIHEETTDQILRDSMIDTLKGRISRMTIPYFVPATPDLVSLPVEAE